MKNLIAVYIERTGALTAQLTPVFIKTLVFDVGHGESVSEQSFVDSIGA